MLLVAFSFLWGALSEERMFLQFTVQSLNGPIRSESAIVNDQVKEDVIDRAWSTNVLEEDFVKDICGKVRRRETITKTKMYVAG
jgi:hypothetical protein